MGMSCSAFNVYLILTEDMAYMTDFQQGLHELWKSQQEGHSLNWE